MLLSSLLLTTLMSTPPTCGQPAIGFPARVALPPRRTTFAEGDKSERDAHGPYPYSLASDNFVVKWGEGGDYTEQDVGPVLDALEQAWEHFIVTLGHPVPLGSDDYKLNVYLGGTGNGTPQTSGVGYFYLDDDEYPMVVLTPQFLADPETITGTAAHEFYHTIQYSSGAFENARWYWESTAEWASGQVFPHGGQSYLFSFLMQPQFALDHAPTVFDGTLDDFHLYGAAIFFTYLSEHAADAALVRDSWLEGGSNDDPLEVLTDLLEDRGLAFPEVYADFAAHTAVLDYSQRDRYAARVAAGVERYPEEDNRLVARLSGPIDGSLRAVDEELLPRGLGFNVIEWTDVPHGRLVVDITPGLEGSRGSATDIRSTLVRQTASGVSYEPVPDNGHLELSGVGDEQALYVVVAQTSPGDRNEVFAYNYALRVKEETAKKRKDGCNASNIELLPALLLLMGLRLLGFASRSRRPETSAGAR